MENKSIGSEIKKIDNLIMRKIMDYNKNEFKNNITPAQIMIMKYLIKNKDKKIYQKDIEKNLPFRKSTISGVMETMEKNNLIKRMDSQSDARSKIIITTQEAEKIDKKLNKKIKEFDKLLNKNITNEELEIFFKVTKKIQDNLKGETNDKII